MTKPRVAILRGGPSDEYDVSLRTGAAVLNAIDTDVYEPFDITITRSGEWLSHGRTRYPEHLLQTMDVVFIALHGAFGEDGTLQRMLDRYGVPYTGSGAYASGIAMHKGYTKDHIKGLNIHLPQHAILSRDELKTSHQHAGEIRARFGSEYIIKPLSSGSSYGVRHVKDTLELAAAISDAFDEYPEIMVEEYIRGREVTCGVIERYRSHEMYALPPIEIIPPAHTSFFSRDVKYDGTTREICPAPLSHTEKRVIEDAACQIHKELDLRQYSRSDFILNKNGLYFLEVNTLPGLTEESLFPKALSAVGATYQDFIHHLISDALHANT